MDGLSSGLGQTRHQKSEILLIVYFSEIINWFQLARALILRNILISTYGLQLTVAMSDNDA